MGTLADLLRDSRFWKDTGQGLTDSVNRGTIAGLLGGPVDAVSGVVNAGLMGLGYAGNKLGLLGADRMPQPIQKPVGGSEWIGDLLQRGKMVSENRNAPAELLAGLLAPSAVRGASKAAFAAEQNAMAPTPYNTAMRGQAGVVPLDVAKGLSTPRKLPSAPEFGQAVQNTPGARISEDGLIFNLQRNQTPEQAFSPSVRGGVFYLPEGAAQAKHYSTGKNGYGGTERISGETLISNPLFAKGGTGGKAPQAAYDQLLGKGSYESMRSDALKAYGGYGAKQWEKEEAVEGFLEKYAPELSGMGSYILQNSKQGNQLAYALQEAAVGSAARNAGHDAVLGYSKGKNGHFISEIFDVRESNYPSKYGDFQLHESIK